MSLRLQLHSLKHFKFRVEELQRDKVLLNLKMVTRKRNSQILETHNTKCSKTWKVSQQSQVNLETWDKVMLVVKTRCLTKMFNLAWKVNNLTKALSSQMTGKTQMAQLMRSIRPLLMI